MNRDSLFIQYRIYVPIEIINNFISLDLAEKLDTTISMQREGPRAQHFTGHDIADVVLHLTEKIADIIIGGIAWDWLKPKIENLYNSIKKNRSIQKITEIQANPIVEFILNYNGKVYHVEFMDNIGEDELSDVLQNLSEYLTPDTLGKIAQNKNYSLYLMTPEFPRKFEAILRYNKQNHHWEPIDFGDHEKKILELHKKVSDLGH